MSGIRYLYGNGNFHEGIFCIEQKNDQDDEVTCKDTIDTINVSETILKYCVNKRLLRSIQTVIKKERIKDEKDSVFINQSSRIYKLYLGAAARGVSRWIRQF